MRVLLTRAREDAEPLAARLAERGIESEIEPLLSFHPESDAAIDLAAVQALIFTSATGVRMFAARSAERQLPVFAVGDATAAAARAAGVDPVAGAAGDVEDLARLIKTRLEPKAGALYHGAARQVAGDLSGQLGAAGFDLRREILYEARPVAALSQPTLTGLAEGRFDAVVFFSPRTAETFVRLVEERDPNLAGTGCHAACLSQAVASRIEALPWAGVGVAERPNQEALIDLLVTLTLDLEARTQQVTADGGSATDERMAEDQETPAPSEDPGDDQDQPALAVIAAFGGIRPMATKLGIAVSTVQGWRERGVIPASRHPQILEAALAHDIDLDPDLVNASVDHSAADETESGDDADETSEAAAPEEAKTDGEAGPERSPADQPPPLAAAPPPVRRGRGVLIGFLLAIVVMVAGAAGAVMTREHWLPLVDRSTAEETDRVGPALQALDGKLADLSGELGGLTTNLASLEARIEDQPAAPVDQSEAQSVLGEAIEELAGRIATIETSVATAGSGPDVAQVDQRLADLESKLDGLSASDGEAPNLAPLLERLASLEERLSEESGVTALGEQQAALSAQLSNSAERLAALEQQAAEAGGRVETLERLAAEAAATPEPKLDGAASVGDVALMLAIIQLKEAVASPGPYQTQLATVSGLIVDSADTAEPLAALAGSAASGAPTREELRRRFPEVARSIVAADAGNDSGSWAAGVMRSFASIVTLRRTGEVTGETADAIAARAEVRVRDGDLAGAVEQLGGLTGHAAAAAEQWRSQAEQRLAAERAVSRLSEQVIAQIAPSSR